MKSSNYDFEVIKKVLLQAYRDKEKVPVSERWPAEVMRRVRNIGPLQSGADRLAAFQQFIWRLAPVTCMLVLVAGTILLKFDYSPESNVLLSLITDTEEITLAQLFPL